MPLPSEADRYLLWFQIFLFISHLTRNQLSQHSFDSLDGFFHPVKSCTCIRSRTIIAISALRRVPLSLFCSLFCSALAHLAQRRHRLVPRRLCHLCHWSHPASTMEEPSQIERVCRHERRIYERCLSMQVYLEAVELQSCLVESLPREHAAPNIL